MVNNTRRSALMVLLVSFMATADLGPWGHSAYAEPVERDEDRRATGRDYDAQYIFAATYGLTDMAVPAALKVPLVPATLVMDLTLLPFEVVAGCFHRNER